MKKRLLIWPGLMLCLLIPFATACGSGLLQPGSNSNPAASQADNELYILDNYTSSGQQEEAQHIVSLPVGTTSPTARLTLPAGPTDLKHQRLYLATPLSNSNQTSISVLDTRSGASMRLFHVSGRYSTAGQDPANAVLSGNGRWLALREQDTPAGTTSIALIDTQAARLVKNIHLNGDFTLDAISPKGTMLYLLEYYEAGTNHYNVRAYNVQANLLVPGNIVDKNELNEKMEGNGLARQMSSDGDMAYTLYINPVTNKAFIHILLLSDTIDNSVPFPVIARCIDLPVGNSPALLHYYTLTLSQDGQTLYAANAALGTIATVNLNLSQNAYQPWMIPNAKIAHFDPQNGAVTTAGQARNLYNGAALSRDQRTLYVAGLHGIWVINTMDLKVRNEYLKQQAFTGLAVSGDGQTLYAVDPATGITLLDPNNGTTRSVITDSVQAPWGIEWATGPTAP